MARQGDGMAERHYRERQAMWDGFQDALTQALTFVAAPLLFAVLGLWLDGRLDTRPLFTVGLLAFGLLGVCVRSIYVYRARVAEEEEGKPWTRRKR